MAGKIIKDFDEFTRELYIMQTVKNNYMPKLIHPDLNKKILFMELGMCSLEDIKSYADSINYVLPDNFTHSILVNLINAIDSLLANKSPID